MPPFSALFGTAELSATMEMAARARALREQGHQVISLSLGEPDFAPAPHILDAADTAARHGATKYTAVNGILPLRTAIAEKFQRDHGLTTSPNDIVVGNGARQVIFNALMAILDPGCEIVIPSPYWNAYPLIATAAGAASRFVPCHAQDDFLPDPEALAAQITARTRCVVLNFPNNPTGAVCPADHLEKLGEVLRAHPHLWILSDDIYEQLIHDGSPHVTLAQICPDLAPRTLTIGGVSKSYAMTGFRVGYAAGPKDFISAITRVQGLATGGVCAIAQAAATAALTGPQEQVTLMRETYAERAQLVAASLKAIPGVRSATPKGAFYAFPDVSEWIGKTTAKGVHLATDTDITLALLQEHHVAIVAGSAFGAAGHVRLSTAAATPDLTQALARIGNFARGLA